jgi:hypothetical protein
MVQVVEHLFRKREALNSNPGTATSSRKGEFQHLKFVV